MSKTAAAEAEESIERERQARIKAEKDAKDAAEQAEKDKQEAVARAERDAQRKAEQAEKSRLDAIEQERKRLSAGGQTKSIAPLSTMPPLMSLFLDAG